MLLKKFYSMLTFFFEPDSSDSRSSVSDSDSSGPVIEDNSFENVFNDTNVTDTEYHLGHEGLINFDDVAVTAIAKRVLAEASQLYYIIFWYFFNIYL